MDLIGEALQGNRGADQQRIAKTGIAWVETLLRKNSDYGSSVWKTPVLAPDCDPAIAIRVRMSDKINRLQTLLAGKSAEVSGESIDDTLKDLGAYCLLYLARPIEAETNAGEPTDFVPY